MAMKRRLGSPSVITLKIASRYYLCKTKWLRQFLEKYFWRIGKPGSPCGTPRTQGTSADPCCGTRLDFQF
jgi:hypothetical protein